MLLDRNLYYLLSFTAGGVLMASEVLVAKLIAPYFGASLYVWAATIGTTLTGLASGYFVASILSSRTGVEKKLLLVTILTTVYLLMLPALSTAILQTFLSFDVAKGIVISTTLFNLPLFFLFGLFSPMIIETLSITSDDAGLYAGRIYGISTISGVLFLLAVALYGLPYLGTTVSVYVCASLMAVMSALLLIKRKLL